MHIVDAHEDIAWNALVLGRDVRRSALETRHLEQDTGVPQRNGLCMVGLPEWLAGGIAIVCGTIFVAPARPGLPEAHSYWQGFQENLARVVPGVRRIRTLPAKVTLREVEPVTVGGQTWMHNRERKVLGARFEVEIRDLGWIPAKHLSEGTLLALGLITAVLGPDAANNLLLDDIDRGLHPQAQARLVQVLRQFQQERPELQVICTSHSPYLLDAFRLEEVRVMGLDAHGYSLCRSLADHPEAEKWRDMLRAGELWASTGEDWVGEAISDEA